MGKEVLFSLGLLFCYNVIILLALLLGFFSEVLPSWPSPPTIPSISAPSYYIM